MKVFILIVSTILAFLSFELGLLFGVSWISSMFFEQLSVYIALGVFVFINIMLYVFLSQLSKIKIGNRR
jgi:choline-glycine betaine transporter